MRRCAKDEQCRFGFKTIWETKIKREKNTKEDVRQCVGPIVQKMWKTWAKAKKLAPNRKE